MSAAMVILPQVWAMAETSSPSRNQSSSPVSERKAPHRLQLVHANQTAPASGAVVRAEKIEHGNYAFYRKYTEAMLLRSMKMSLEIARVPSFLGTAVFRGEVRSGKVCGFDDVVNYVTDLDNCMKTLGPGRQHLVKRIAMQQYSHSEVAAMLGISLRTVIRRYNEALDELTRLLLSRKLMQPLMASQGVE